MDKSTMESVISKMESAGITEYYIRTEGGNRKIYHGNDNAIIHLASDAVIGLETQTHIQRTVKGRFSMSIIPYDNIDDMNIDNLSVEQALKLCRAFGMSEDEYIDMIKKNGARIVAPTPTNSTANVGEQYDSEGKVIIHEQIPARLS